MILSLFRKNTATAEVFAAYAAIVAQSRQVRFYADWQVPDTMTGRFDMISLHMALLFRRLRSDEPRVKAFGQALFDLFFKDMDRSLREMGISDLGIPKRVQKMSGVFYGLLASLAAALDAGDRAALEAVIARNVFAGTESPAVADFAAYLDAEAARLEALPIDVILSGRLTVEEPA